MINALSEEQEALQVKISTSCDQLIAALTGSLEIGVITPTTRFAETSEDFSRGFLVNVGHAYRFDDHALDSRVFVYNPRGAFSGAFVDGNSPEFYIGNDETIPFIERRLRDYFGKLPIDLRRVLDKTIKRYETEIF